MFFNYFIDFLFQLSLWFFRDDSFLFTVDWFIDICYGVDFFGGLLERFADRTGLNFDFVSFSHGGDLNAWIVVHWDAFKELIGIDFALFEFLDFIEHLSFLFFDLLFHQLSLVEELLSFIFNDIGFEHFFLYFFNKFFLFILLDFHDSFDIFFFVGSFNDILIVFFFYFLLTFFLYFDKILLFGLYFF